MAALLHAHTYCARDPDAGAFMKCFKCIDAETLVVETGHVSLPSCVPMTDRSYGLVPGIQSNVQGAYAAQARYTILLPYFWPFFRTIMPLCSGTLMALT